MNLLDNFRTHFRAGNVVKRLILINVALFLVVSVTTILLKLFRIDGGFLVNLLSVPSSPSALLTHLWTPLTYMFFHKQFFHILFNMLMLYWFGQLFSIYYSEKKLLSVYLFGGLMGALFFVLAYNFFPYYSDMSHRSVLMGASGSIIALIVAAAVRAPQMEVQLLLLGRVKLIWIALGMVLISVFGLTSDNAGGELAHLGGALAGYLFVAFEKKGKDITAFITWIIDFFVNLFRPKPKLKKKVYHAQKMSPGEYNQKKATDEKEINRILDKIKLSGYESLTADEKRKLFEQKK